jgi:putative transposase
MSIPLIDKDDVIDIKDKTNSIKEIKEKVKNQKYKTYTVGHDLDLNQFFWIYNDTLNSVIHDIWNSIEWKEVNIRKDKDKNGKKKIGYGYDYCKYNQVRLYPNYKKDSKFKKELRHKYLDAWEYSAHWINSVIDVAYSIMDSWKKNYNKGRRKRNCPNAKRLFVRIKQTLMKIDADKLRISIKPRQFVYIDLTGRYFKINGKIGEPILTPDSIHLPIVDIGRDNEEIKPCHVGWDMNKLSMDGFSPELGWVRIGLNELYTTHVSYDNKRRRINKIVSTKKIVGKRLNAKYSKREKNRCGQIAHEITNIVKKIGIKHGFEDIDKNKLFIRRGRRTKKWNKELGYNNWKQIIDIMEYKSDIEIVDPENTSKECSRCGCVNKDLKGERFECINKDCGLVINRQINAAINIYLRMEGLSQSIQWFDLNVLHIMKSEFTQTGTECVSSTTGTARKDANELVRHLYDSMKSQFYMVGSSSDVLKTTWDFNRTHKFYITLLFT